MERVPLLVATEGPLKGNRYQVVEGDGLYLGRSDGCEITIPDPEVSRQHAKVTLHNAGIWVLDAGSRNGVFINDKRVVRPTELRPGGKLTIGGHEFLLELVDVEDDDPSVIRPKPQPIVKKSSATPKIVVALVVIVAAVIAFALWS